MLSDEENESVSMCVASDNDVDIDRHEMARPIHDAPESTKEHAQGCSQMS